MRSLPFRTLLSALLLACLSAAQQPVKADPPTELSASPEMNRLAKALAGDWNTIEIMECGEFFPTAARAMESDTSGSAPAGPR